MTAVHYTHPESRPFPKKISQALRKEQGGKDLTQPLEKKVRLW